MSVAQPSLPLRERSVRVARTMGRADAVALAILGTMLCIVVALTWRKWGSPEIDAGAELTAADRVTHGAVPYRDIRYFYGPLGLYELAAAFRVFGSTYATAFGFGLAQTAAILGVFYALARTWLRVPAATIATAMLLAIAFSGTGFDFVLPHTNSATTGLLLVLVQLLALRRRRLWTAGIAGGLVCLTRPEFALVAAAVVVAYLAGTWREGTGKNVRRIALRLVVPGIALPVIVLGAFGWAAGLHRLLFEDLWPVDFIRVAGFRSQANWMPFTAASGAGLVARAAVYAGLLTAVVAAPVLWQSGRRARAALVPAAAVAGLLVVDLAARTVGLLEMQRRAVESDSRHLLLGMSWLPALALALAAYTVWSFLRRRASPLSGSWANDAALITAAALLGGRAYNAFTANASYAPYYAAPLVLLAGVLHQRLGDIWPAARRASLAMFACAGLGLAAYSLIGLYPDDARAVHTPRGTYVENSAAAGAVQQAVTAIERATHPAEPILVAPSDAGLYFMTGRTPALDDLMLLPGLLDSAADERSAIARLRARHVALAVIGERDFGAYGFRTFGVDYDGLLGAWLRDVTLGGSVIGDGATPAAGTYASRGFHVLRLRTS